MRFGSTAKVLAKCMLEHYRISEQRVRDEAIWFVLTSGQQVRNEGGESWDQATPCWHEQGAEQRPREEAIWLVLTSGQHVRNAGGDHWDHATLAGMSRGQSSGCGMRCGCWRARGAKNGCGTCSGRWWPAAAVWSQPPVPSTALAPTQVPCSRPSVRSAGALSAALLLCL